MSHTQDHARSGTIGGGGWFLGGLVGTLLVMLMPGSASAQAPEEPVEAAVELPAPPTGRPVRGLRVRSDPGAAMTTLTLVFPEGGATDPAEGTGATFLLGRLLQAQGEQALLPLGGTLAIQAEQGQVALVVSVPSPRWEEGWARVQRLLETDPLSSALLEEARARRLDELLFQQGTPVQSFLAAWQRHAFASSLPVAIDAGRPIGGTVDGVRGVTLSMLDARRRDVFRIERSQAILMAPPPPESSAQLDFHVPESAGAVGSVGAGGRSAPWEGSRQVVDRDLTSTWIGLAWAIPEGVHWVTVSFLAQRLQEMLNPSLPEPGIYRTEVSPVRAGDRTLLTVVATVDPSVALRRERQVIEALGSLGTEAMTGLGLDLAQRRWKSEVAAVRSNAVEEGFWLARQLGPGLASSEILPNPDALRGLLSGTVIRDLAASLSAPRIFVYGPVPMMSP
jgi:hypothetical protein